MVYLLLLSCKQFLSLLILSITLIAQYLNLLYFTLTSFFTKAIFVCDSSSIIYYIQSYSIPLITSIYSISSSSIFFLLATIALLSFSLRFGSTYSLHLYSFSVYTTKLFIRVSIGNDNFSARKDNSFYEFDLYARRHKGFLSLENTTECLRFFICIKVIIFYNKSM